MRTVWHHAQDNTRRIFEAAKAPSISLFTELMAPVMVAKPTSYEALMKIPTPHWTHHATCAGNVVLDQVTSHLAESTMNMVDSEVGTQYISGRRVLRTATIVVS